MFQINPSVISEGWQAACGSSEENTPSCLSLLHTASPKTFAPNELLAKDCHCPSEVSLWSSLPETHSWEQTIQNIDFITWVIIAIFSFLLLLRYHLFFSQDFFCLFLFYNSEVVFELAYQNHSYISAFPTLYFSNSALCTVLVILFPSNDSDYSSFRFPTLYVWKGITNEVSLPQPVSSFRLSDLESSFLSHLPCQESFPLSFQTLPVIFKRTEHYNIKMMVSRWTNMTPLNNFTSDGELWLSHSFQMYSPQIKTISGKEINTT